MNEESIEKTQGKLESISRKWWFFLLFIILQFVPPYASKGFEWPETGMVIGEIISSSLVVTYTALYPIFKIIPIILVISVIFLRNKVTRLFDVYAAITYVLFAFLQSIAVTEKYGLGIVINNFVMFNLVAAFWFWEAIAQKNDFTPRKQPIWKYWVIPSSFLAFWYPLNSQLMPDFNPISLLTNAAGLTFCMMTPVYLAILTLYYPRTNIVTLRVTSLAGTIIGFYNIQVNFFIAPSVLWWNGVLHMPLLIISIYGLILSLKRGHILREEEYANE